MIYKKLIKTSYLIILLIFVMAMNVSNVKAEDSNASNIDTAQSDTIEQQNISEENDPSVDEGEEYIIEKIELSIEGMTSYKDEMKLKEALWNCSGIEDVRVSHKYANANIQVYVEEADYNEIIEAVEKAGFTVVEQ